MKIARLDRSLSSSFNLAFSHILLRLRRVIRPELPLMLRWMLKFVTAFKMVFTMYLNMLDQYKRHLVTWARWGYTYRRKCPLVWAGAWDIPRGEGPRWAWACSVRNKQSPPPMSWQSSGLSPLLSVWWHFLLHFTGFDSIIFLSPKMCKLIELYSMKNLTFHSNCFVKYMH